jgi:hypothetical protein
MARSLDSEPEVRRKRQAAGPTFSGSCRTRWHIPDAGEDDPRPLV